MTQKYLEQAILIIRATDDGRGLAPEDMKLVEYACNSGVHGLTEDGEKAFGDLYQRVTTGQYRAPWFHGVEHMTIDQLGHVSWKGRLIEHFNLNWAWSEGAKRSAQELERRCKLLESKGIEISPSTVIWSWPDEWRVDPVPEEVVDA